MKMIKILQISTVLMFVLIVVFGFIVLFTDPELMPNYLALVTGIFPIFLAQVIPALIGTPLTEFIRAKSNAVAPPEPQKDDGK